MNSTLHQSYLIKELLQIGLHLKRTVKQSVAAFKFSWAEKVIWLVPLVYLIAKVINHFLATKRQSKEILVCPYWSSSIFWPMLMSSLGTPKKFVKDYYSINNAEGYVELGGFKGSFIGSKRFTGSFVSFYLVK